MDVPPARSARTAPPGRAVIFDLGGVVLDWRPRELLQRFYPAPDAALRETVWRAVFDHPDWLDLDRGVLSHAAAIPRFAARAARPEAEMAGLLLAVRDSLQPLPATIALMRRLDAAGVPLYCLSNMHAEIADWLVATHDFWPLFRGIVFSAHERCLKPDPAIFRLLLERHGLEAAATAFVDDHPANVEAARRLGLHAIAFADAAQCDAALRAWLVRAE
ncbi:MAG: HAD family phosphatase [Steroidobacteraceae bacterium]|jgi:putative hydrolase of the HAD superfamily|nr:HAD family phosphatase [Steroidobacteraceae bacterium]